jgi:CRP-like cAMP-binding protein
MFESFRRYLKDNARLTPKEQELIESLSISKVIKKKQFLLRAGDVCRHHTFICKGCMKLYRTGNEGAEHIIKFAVEDWWISDRESLLSGEPAESYIVALEDTGVLQWTNEQFENLYKAVPAFDALFKRLVSKALDAAQNRVYSSISKTAEEKYVLFNQRYPGLIARVPLHMIASYLGLTRETLTRIRHRYRNEKM